MKKVIIMNIETKTMKENITFDILSLLASNSSSTWACTSTIIFSARLFGLWITVPAFIMVLISLIFLKNQTRPITNLAKAAERFGRGENIDDFRPAGALEIRQAGYEFDKMRKRIMRHLNQRSEMLSGISHDLRTPLTRMKLQLAFIKDEKLSKKISLDIDEIYEFISAQLSLSQSLSLNGMNKEKIKIIINKALSAIVTPKYTLN